MFCKINRSGLNEAYIGEMVEIYFRYYNLPAEESAMAQIKNPMCEVFPRVANCTYWRYGSGGGQTRKYILHYNQMFRLAILHS